MPVSAGGSSEKIARLVAEKLCTSWGQTIIVENVTGAGGAIGAAQVVRAQRDGYTLVLHSDATVIKLAAVTEQIKGGKLRASAVTPDYRSPVFPDVPTMAKSGYPAVSIESWQGMLASKGTPTAILEKN